MAGGAGDVAAVRAAPCFGVAAGATGQHGLAAHPPGVHRAEGGGGEGGEHARVRANGLGDALATAQARTDELASVALETAEQAGQTASRRFPHATCGTPPGSLAVSQTGAVSPVARSMALIRPISRMGWEQVPVVASWRSQARKSAQVMVPVVSSSAVALSPGP